MKPNTDKKIGKINNPRIVNYTQRTRSGDTQVFCTGNDEHGVAITIRIKAPERSWYAELIDGEWWWLDGCNQCNDRDRSVHGYLNACDKHDTCVTCHKPRSEIKDTVWGHKQGFQCQPCHDIAHEAAKQAALAAMPEEYDSWDYHGKDEITCPYCAFEFSDSFESYGDDNETHECPVCDNDFKVTAVHSLTFDCERIEA